MLLLLSDRYTLTILTPTKVQCLQLVVLLSTVHVIIKCHFLKIIFSLILTILKLVKRHHEQISLSLYVVFKDLLVITYVAVWTIISISYIDIVLTEFFTEILRTGQETRAVRQFDRKKEKIKLVKLQSQLSVLNKHHNFRPIFSIYLHMATRNLMTNYQHFTCPGFWFYSSV